jgi:hypothetical protein
MKDDGHSIMERANRSAGQVMMVQLLIVRRCVVVPFIP